MPVRTRFRVLGLGIIGIRLLAASPIFYAGPRPRRPRRPCRRRSSHPHRSIAGSFPNGVTWTNRTANAKPKAAETLIHSCGKDQPAASYLSQGFAETTHYGQ